MGGSSPNAVPAASLAAFIWERISRRYAFGVVGSIARITLIVCLGVEGIFLSDLLISELLPRVLEHRGGPAALLQLLVLSAPDGLFLSLPLAILIASYLTLLRRREAGEFAVLAGMGHSAQVLVGMTVIIGLGFFVLSSVISAYVEPLARYQRERSFADMTFRAMSDAEIGAGKFYSLAGLTVFAASGRLAQGADHVFIYRDLGKGDEQVLLADQAGGVKDETGLPLGLLLSDLTVLNYSMTNTSMPLIAPSGFTEINRFFVDFPSVEQPALRARTDRIDNSTSFELLSRLEQGDARATIGKRLLRGLLCLLAPMLALLAMTLTRPATLLLALPGTAALLLGASFFGPRLVEALAPLPLAASLGLLVGATGATALTLWGATIRREAACFRLGGVAL